MSVPIRNRSCGCVIGSRLNRHDTKPFWCYWGLYTEEKIQTCPVHFHFNYTRRILFIFKDVGYMAWKTRGSYYITINEHRYRNIFLFSDVYCKECNKWHY